MSQTDAQRDPFRLAGHVLDGRFRVEREVAEGGFGVVYYAVQVALDRPVALKVLKTPSGMDAKAQASFRDKFAAEAKTIARIRHPHIVDVHDFGISAMPSGEQAPWMALEWLSGQTLEDHLLTRRGQGGRSPKDVLTLLRPVFRAFSYAHREGIAHRDIKPANIMVVTPESGPATTDQGAMLRVLDFGIAKLMDADESPGSGLTRTAGLPAFSPLYSAPEQVAYGRTGPWTDVHALGLLLTEMLVDQPPYGATDMQLFEEVMGAARPTPLSKGRMVGPWESIIARALALSPGERWKSASELLSALEVTAEEATVAARAPLVARRARAARIESVPKGGAPDGQGPVRRLARLVGGGRRPVFIGAVMLVALAAVVVSVVAQRRPAERLASSPSPSVPTPGKVSPPMGRVETKPALIVPLPAPTALGTASPTEPSPDLVRVGGSSSSAAAHEREAQPLPVPLPRSKATDRPASPRRRHKIEIE